MSITCVAILAVFGNFTSFFVNYSKNCCAIQKMPPVLLTLHYFLLKPSIIVMIGVILVKIVYTDTKIKKYMTLKPIHSYSSISTKDNRKSNRHVHTLLQYDRYTKLSSVGFNLFVREQQSYRCSADV